ncbi:MAG: hypothetical protein CO117_00850 [Flavobacteriaceae bacterium CG_4_9_14_3_um_filter_33_16]|nr:MAG: hypothetical protein CO117_00850 [Flavobacteriaceae bacterium CG_4_9_14_3_um_filter_33_16]
MSRYTSGQYEPKNPKKYIGKYPIIYRSSWELGLMQKFDIHPNITEWASESLQIPYRNPFTNKDTIYVPDFFVKYIDKTNKIHVEIIEIKPLKETLLEKAKSKKDKLSVALNTVKWQAAQAFCKKAGITFRIMTEEQLFRK